MPECPCFPSIFLAHVRTGCVRSRYSGCVSFGKSDFFIAIFSIDQVSQLV